MRCYMDQVKARQTSKFMQHYVAIHTHEAQRTVEGKLNQDGEKVLPRTVMEVTLLNSCSMDFLKKAKAQMKELEGDFKKVTASINDLTTHSEAEVKSSSTSTPAINTPSSTTAPSMASAARPKSEVKLPLLARKNVRDNYDPVKPEAEAKISSILGTPWTIDFDIGLIWENAQEVDDPNPKHVYAQENPGKMLAEYANAAVRRIEEYTKKFGADGVEELNKLASNHTIILEPGEGPIQYKTTTDITDGFLRIVFEKKYLGYNIASIMEKLGEAINKAGVSGDAGLSFDARTSLKVYEDKIGAVKARLEQITGASPLTITVNFEEIYAKLVASEAAGNKLTRDWQKYLGTQVLSYFEKLADGLTFAGFQKDDLLQEGFQEAVSKNEIVLRIVDTLERPRKTYNENIIHDGVLYLQTVTKYWWANNGQIADNLVDLL